MYRLDFPQLRKYPHKENMFFVESDWNKLGWIGISDLGVILNEDLKFSKHVTSISEKVST